MNKSENTTKNPVVVLFIERVFHSFEGNVCTCDSLADPCSIQTFDNGTSLVFEIIYILTSHRVWRSFKSLNLMDTLTLPGATPLHNCFLTRLAYHAWNLFQINFFVDKLMLISKGWNLFVRLCGTITKSQLFFAHNRLISSFHSAMKVSLIMKERWSSS